MRFYALVDLAAASIPAVHQFAADLKEYADLRNAIVHGPRDSPIAEPFEQTVAHLDEISRLIREPPLLITKLAVGSVRTCMVDDALFATIELMRESRFSQVPAYDGDTFAALLTAETIMRWLAATAGGSPLSGARVSDALPHAESEDNVVLVPATMDVFEALRLFDEYQESGRSLDAILVTEAGAEAAIAIATIFDIPLLSRDAHGSIRRTAARSTIVPEPA